MERPEIHEFNLGYFLKPSHIEKGFKLLKSQMNDDRWTFRCLDLETYRREKYADSFDPDQFYWDYVAYDQFYNDPGLFYNIPYDIPKLHFGKRPYNFTSFHLQVLYYAVGMYLLELCKSGMKRYERRFNQESLACTAYGGKIDVEEPGKSETHYFESYQSYSEFRENMVDLDYRGEKEIFVIDLDIASYFPSIDHQTLLDQVEGLAKKSERKKLQFTNATKESIQNFWNFVMKSSSGLLQSKQNVVSRALSFVYLLKFDEYVFNELPEEQWGTRYSRFVDDITISLSKIPGSGEDSNTEGEILRLYRIEALESIVNGFGNFLKKDLNLNINDSKTGVTILGTPQESQEYRRANRRGYFLRRGENTDKGGSEKQSQKQLTEEEKKEKVENEKRKRKNLKFRFDKAMQILDIVHKNYRSTGRIHSFTDHQKYVYGIFGLIKHNFVSAKNPLVVDSLNGVFSGWPFRLISYNPKVLLKLFSISSHGLDGVEKYYQSFLSRYASDIIFLSALEEYVISCEYGQELKETIKRVESDFPYMQLIQRLLNPTGDRVSSVFPIRKELLAREPGLAQQVKMLKISEIEERYNTAFNHLLNVLHEYCWLVFRKMMGDDSVEKKSYKVTNVEDDLEKFDIPPSNINFVVDLFDRRNKNSLSHSGETELSYWPVSEDEYFENKEEVRKLIMILDKKISSGSMEVDGQKSI